jgi:hypothetical protein
MEIITTLQTKIAPQVFTPRAVYDGRKNLFAAKELPFGESGMKEVNVLYIRVYLYLRHSAHRPCVQSSKWSSAMRTLAKMVNSQKFTKSGSTRLPKSTQSMLFTTDAVTNLNE